MHSLEDSPGKVLNEAHVLLGVTWIVTCICATSSCDRRRFERAFISAGHIAEGAGLMGLLDQWGQAVGRLLGELGGPIPLVAGLLGKDGRIGGLAGLVQAFQETAWTTS